MHVFWYINKSTPPSIAAGGNNIFELISNPENLYNSKKNSRIIDSPMEMDIVFGFYRSECTNLKICIFESLKLFVGTIISWYSGMLQ